MCRWTLVATLAGVMSATRIHTADAPSAFARAREDALGSETQPPSCRLGAGPDRAAARDPRAQGRH